MRRFPSLFVSHGAPTLALESGGTADFLRDLGKGLERPTAIICVSAHWDRPSPSVSGAASPRTVHDFVGFPQQLYALRYPAPGSPELARKIADALAAIGLQAQVDHDRGLDHGVWVPLTLMYPAADVPVVALSVDSGADPTFHFDIGRALDPFRAQGFLILGSGGATHNLRDVMQRPPLAPPLSYAQEFTEWLCLAVTQGRTGDLLEYRERAPHAERAHPTTEHFLPLFVALGAAGAPLGRVLHREFAYGALSLAAFAWD
jgi:4,5-DOPA dioxygenase extradiol